MLQNRSMLATALMDWSRLDRLANYTGSTSAFASSMTDLRCYTGYWCKRTLLWSSCRPSSSSDNQLLSPDRCCHIRDLTLSLLTQIRRPMSNPQVLLKYNKLTSQSRNSQLFWATLKQGHHNDKQPTPNSNFWAAAEP